MVKRLSNDVMVQNIKGFAGPIADATARAAAGRANPDAPLTADDLKTISKTQAGYRDVFEKMAELTQADGPVAPKDLASLAERALKSKALGWDVNHDGYVDVTELADEQDLAMKSGALACVAFLGDAEPAAATGIAVAPAQVDSKNLGDALRSKGLRSEYDVSAIEPSLSAGRRSNVESWRGRPPADERGDGLARNVLANSDLDPNHLTIAFVGGAHVPAVNYAAAKAGYLPLITGALDTVNLTSPHMTNVASDFMQDGIAITLSNAVAQRSVVSVKSDAPVLLTISDLHMADYAFTAPTVDELKAAGITQVGLLLENYRDTAISLGALSSGPAVPSALAQIMKSYEAAGISVKVKGLESQDLRVETPFVELDKPSAQHLANSPTFVALASEQWRLPAEYGSWTRQQALGFLTSFREAFEANGPSWSAQVARIDRAISEVKAEQTGD